MTEPRKPTSPERETTRTPSKKNETLEKLERIVDRKEERGTPYPGDFPNPLGNRDRGCF